LQIVWQLKLAIKIHRGRRAAAVATSTSETFLAACRHPKTRRTAMASEKLANRLAIKMRKSSGN
jgi:hypothetical protein